MLITPSLYQRLHHANKAQCCCFHAWHWNTGDHNTYEYEYYLVTFHVTLTPLFSLSLSAATWVVFFISRYIRWPLRTPRHIINIIIITSWLVVMLAFFLATTPRRLTITTLPFSTVAVMLSLKAY